MTKEKFNKQAQELFDNLDDEYGKLQIDKIDLGEWLNENCLEVNRHDILLGTGGPAYGITLANNTPAYWYQDWNTPKTFRQPEGQAFNFLLDVFDLLKEMRWQDE